MKELEPYLSAFSGASDRTRSIYFIVLTFSIICLATSLKTLNVGWNQSMLQKSKLTYFHLLNTVEGKPLISPLSKEEIEIAKSFQAAVKYKTVDQAKLSYETIRKQVSDGSYFTIPIFGISFHANDLGLIAGVSLTLLLMLLKRALAREQDNFNLVFDKAKEVFEANNKSTEAGEVKTDSSTVFKYCYDIMSTNELLHRPEPLNTRTFSFFTRPVMDVSFLMLCIPLIAYAIVLSNDYRTRMAGYILSPDYASFILYFEYLSFILILYFIISCYYIILGTRRMWAALYDKAKIEPPAV